MEISTNKKISLGIVLVGGLSVLGSYVPVFQNTETLWYDINTNLIKFYFLPLMLVAAGGFLTYFIEYLIKPDPQKGLLSYGFTHPLLLAILLLASTAWSIFQVRHVKTNQPMYAILASTSLVVTAICSILLLAGTVEADESWLGVVGLGLFCLTTVINDGVVYNAKMIFETFRETSRS
tara:strand:- start:315 stop:848 length:534 start_codon:yes stop_codon:yes gene_type:complete